MTPDIVKQIRKATRRRFTAEEKIRIVLEGLRGESTRPQKHRPGRKRSHSCECPADILWMCHIRKPEVASFNPIF